MSIDGNWSVELEFLRGHARHALCLTQEGNDLRGRYRSQFGEREITGYIDGDHIELRSSVHYEHCGTGYQFSGRIEGDRMEGTLGLGEYWTAKWSATRHEA
jgi:D-glucosaminate-6-phosphate ammonia-lyase